MDRYGPVAASAEFLTWQPATLARLTEFGHERALDIFAQLEGK
jgi:hypothetical protein